MGGDFMDRLVEILRDWQVWLNALFPAAVICIFFWAFCKKISDRSKRATEAWKERTNRICRAHPIWQTTYDCWFRDLASEHFRIEAKRALLQIAIALPAGLVLSVAGYLEFPTYLPGSIWLSASSGVIGVIVIGTFFGYRTWDLLIVAGGGYKNS